MNQPACRAIQIKQHMQCFYKEAGRCAGTSSSWGAAFCSGSSRLLYPFQWTNKEDLYNLAASWPFMCFHHDMNHRAAAISPLCYGRDDIHFFRCLFIQSINQSIYLMSWGATGTNRQKVQFSEFIQSDFASYMQSIPSQMFHS